MTIEQLLKTEGKYVGPVKGTSMLPMLVAERDSIVVYARKGPYKPLDVVLYKRGEEYILHRVIKAKGDKYIIRGDNCYFDELVGEGQILGVLREYFSGEKLISCEDKKYLRYAKRRVRYYFARNITRKTRAFAKRILRIPYRIFLKLKGKK